MAKLRDVHRRSAAAKVTALVLAGAATVLSACNTVAGAGQDISATGHAITPSRVVRTKPSRPCRRTIKHQQVEAQTGRGNPGGRPKALRSVEEEARKHTALAMQTLASIANDIKAPPLRALQRRLCCSTAAGERRVSIWKSPPSMSSRPGPWKSCARIRA